MRGQVFSFPLGLTLSIAPAWQQCLAFFGTPLVIEPRWISSPATPGCHLPRALTAEGPPALRCDAASFRRMVKAKQESERALSSPADAPRDTGHAPPRTHHTHPLRPQTRPVPHLRPTGPAQTHPSPPPS